MLRSTRECRRRASSCSRASPLAYLQMARADWQSRAGRVHILLLTWVRLNAGCGGLMLVCMPASMRAAATCWFAHACARLHRRVLVFYNFVRETQAAILTTPRAGRLAGRQLSRQRIDACRRKRTYRFPKPERSISEWRQTREADRTPAGGRLVAELHRSTRLRRHRRDPPLMQLLRRRIVISLENAPSGAGKEPK